MSQGFLGVFPTTFDICGSGGGMIKLVGGLKGPLFGNSSTGPFGFVVFCVGVSSVVRVLVIGSMVGV